MSGTSLTDTSGDQGMMKVMAIVILCLVVLSVLIVTMARLLGDERNDENDPVMRNALISRIEPVGAVRTSAEELEQVAAAPAMAMGLSGRSGEELVNGVCASCHSGGVGGAPLLGDEAAWAERRELGLDALVASVINGKGAMGARGGSDYSDEDIRLAVQHIALFEVTDDTATEGAAVEDAEPAEAAADTDAEVSAPAEETAEEAAEETTAVAAAPAAGGEPDLVAMIGSGAEPEGLTDEIKTQVNGVCAGCHVAGVAGAPMPGDVAGWTPRAQLGLAALTQSVANGKGVMPPRGGSTLTDEQLAIAIQYQIGKAAP